MSGGATQLWAEAFLVIATGTFFLVRPPRVSVGPVANGLWITLVLLALMQFLPVSWTGLPEWRQVLTTKFGVHFPPTRSAQPWLSLEGFGLYLAGLAWAYYLLGQTWNRTERHRALRLYGLGIVVLAAVSLTLYWEHAKVPFWPLVRNSPINFGFFPNRNQTANVLALGGIMLGAVGFESTERRGVRGLGWFPLVLLVCVALVVDFSRAGVILFFGGAAAWLGWTIPTTSSKKIGTLCLAGMLLMLAAFLLFGGETLRRFQPEPSDNARQWTDFRFKIQSDAVDFIAQAPVFGQGLGNFEFIFPIYRDKSAGQNFAIHPESDWLWAAAELGWPTAILLFVGLAWWLPRCFPFDRKSDRRLRMAATVCAVAFALHGIGDVSGHRAGAAWPALLLMSLALNPHRVLRPSTWTIPLFRAVGVILLCFGAWWLASTFAAWGDLTMPTSQTLARIKTKSDAAMAAKDYERVIALTTEGLRTAPLDWRLYFQRGVANAVSYSTAPAKADFALARYLVPQWAESCFIEGELWLALEKPDLGWDAWKEALRRAGDGAPALYRRMLSEPNLNFRVRSDLEELCRGNRDFWLVFLDFASPLECDLQIGELLAQDPALLTLQPAQRRKLFRIWHERANRSLLITSLLANPRWLEEGWPWLALDYVRMKEFRRAYELAHRYTPPPSLPAVNEGRPFAELERNFFFHDDDLQFGIALFLAQRRIGRVDDALKTLQRLKKIRNRPAYLLYLESELYAGKGLWEQAWQSRLEYGPL